MEREWLHLKFPITFICAGGMCNETVWRERVCDMQLPSPRKRHRFIRYKCRIERKYAYLLSQQGRTNDAFSSRPTNGSNADRTGSNAITNDPCTYFNTITNDPCAFFTTSTVLLVENLLEMLRKEQWSEAPLPL